MPADRAAWRNLVDAPIPEINIVAIIELACD
eukprot:SAG11_NODE_37770_length_255_cov_0.846154_1_plen_30_part_10